MTPRLRSGQDPQPPRLALALLNRVVPQEEPLTGDLVEEFAAGRSRGWFWRQAIAAVALTAFRQSDEVRPLRLVDGAPARVPATATAPRRTVNLSASPVAGIGGLTIAVLLVLMTMVMPQAWWLVAAAIAAGAVFGVVLIAIRRTTRD